MHNVKLEKFSSIPVKFFDKYSVTDDILKQIFSYLDFASQSCASLTCHKWRSAMKDFSLNFGKTFAVLNMSLKEANSKQLLVYKENESVRFHGTYGKLALFSKVDSKMVLVNVETAKFIEFDLEILGEDKTLTEKKCIKFAILFSEQKLLTVTCCGIIAIWEFSKCVIRCIQYVQIFSSELFKNEISNKFAKPSLEKAFMFQKKVCIVGYLCKSRQFFEVFDLELTKKSSQIFNLETDSDSKFLKFETNNFHKIFDLYRNWMARQLHLKVSYLNEENMWISDPKILLLSDLDTEGDDCEGDDYKVVKPNDKWLVVVQFYKKTISKKSKKKNKREVALYHVFDANSLNKVFKFEIDLDHCAKQTEYVYLMTNPGWLCDDFFVALIGSELKFWHIPSMSYLTLINLENIFVLKQINTKLILNSPVLHVDITNNEIKILLLNQKTHIIELIEFSLDSLMNPDAQKRAKEQPPKYIDFVEESPALKEKNNSFFVKTAHVFYKIIFK